MPESAPTKVRLDKGGMFFIASMLIAIAGLIFFAFGAIMLRSSNLKLRPPVPNYKPASPPKYAEEVVEISLGLYHPISVNFLNKTPFAIKAFAATIKIKDKSGRVLLEKKISKGALAPKGRMDVVGDKITDSFASEVITLKEIIGYEISIDSVIMEDGRKLINAKSFVPLKYSDKLVRKLQTEPNDDYSPEEGEER